MNLFNRLRLWLFYIWCVQWKRTPRPFMVRFLMSDKVIAYYHRHWRQDWYAPVVGGGQIELGRLSYKGALRELARVQPGAKVIHTDFEQHFIFIMN